MNTYRRNAIIVGILFIACTVFSIISMSMTNSFLDATDYIAKLAANQHQAVTAALFELIWAATGLSIAIWLYPVIKKQNEGLALGSVIFRGIENVAVIIGTLCFLTLLSLSANSQIPGAAGELLVAARDWSHLVITIIFFALGALMYYTVLYRSRLIPHWLSGWGFIAACLCLIVTVIGAFNRDFLSGTVNTVLNAPLGIQEMVLALWLIIKGFDRQALAALPD